MPLKKGAWSPEEDHKLITYINRYRIWNWSQMARPAGLERSGKSCRFRWVNHLRPGIKRGKFSKEEEDTVLKWHGVLGNRWSAIAAKLPGRTDNEIKNYWQTHLKKRYTNNSVEPPGVEANINESPEIQDLSAPNAPKMSNLPDSWSWAVGMSLQLSDLDDLSSSSNDDPVEIDRNQTILEETFTSPSETLELQSLWEQPFSLDDMCMVETDNGIIYVSSY